MSCRREFESRSDLADLRHVTDATENGIGAPPLSRDAPIPKKSLSDSRWRRSSSVPSPAGQINLDLIRVVIGE